VEPTEAPEPAPEPAAEPEAAAELDPLEVELETNHLTCMGNADCTTVELDCCCGQKTVATNKGSADEVSKTFKRAADACSSVECPTEECAKPAAECVSFKCALVE
jgi:hypothetical protein